MFFSTALDIFRPRSTKKNIFVCPDIMRIGLLPISGKKLLILGENGTIRKEKNRARD